jgi:hypothetical protein
MELTREKYRVLILTAWLMWRQRITKQFSGVAGG